MLEFTIRSSKLIQHHPNSAIITQTKANANNIIIIDQAYTNFIEQTENHINTQPQIPTKTQQTSSTNSSSPFWGCSGQAEGTWTTHGQHIIDKSSNIHHRCSPNKAQDGNLLLSRSRKHRHHNEHSAPQVRRVQSAQSVDVLLSPRVHHGGKISGQECLASGSLSGPACAGPGAGHDLLKACADPTH